MIHKGKMIKWNSSTIKCFATQKNFVRLKKCKDKAQTKAKYQEIIYLIKDLYLEYIKYFYNSMGSQTTQFHNGQNI